MLKCSLTDSHWLSKLAQFATHLLSLITAVMLGDTEQTGEGSAVAVPLATDKPPPLSCESLRLIASIEAHQTENTAWLKKIASTTNKSRQHPYL